MKASIFLLFACVLVSARSATAASDQIDWSPFSLDDLQSILKDYDTTYLIHFRNSSCDASCEKELRLVLQNAETLKKEFAGLRVHSVELDQKGEIAQELAIFSHSGLFVLFKGHSIRIDTNDVVPKTAVDLIAETRKLLQAHPLPIESEAAFSGIKSSAKYIHVFNGNKTSKLWVEIELAAKMNPSKIYYTANLEVGQAIGLNKKNGFYTIESTNGKVVPLEGRVNFDLLHWFLMTSAHPIPRDFNIEELRKATKSGVPVVLYKGSDKEEDQRLTRLLEDLDITLKNHFQVFRLTDDSQEDQKTLREHCTRHEEKPETVFCILLDHQGKLLRYIFEEEKVGYKSLNKFIKKYLSGELVSYHKSETIKKTYLGQVKNLNTYTLDHLLAPSEGDLALRAILYYSDAHLGHDLQNLFTTVSSKFSELLIRFGRVNVDRNEIFEDISSHTLPFVKVSRSHEDPAAEVYKGSLDLHALHNWIAQQVKKREDEVKEFIEEETDL